MSRCCRPPRLNRVPDHTGSGDPSDDVPYRALFDIHPHPMWVFDTATLRFLLVNEAAVRDYGHTRGEFAEMTVDELAPEEDAADLRKHLRALPEGIEEAGVWRHRTRAGHTFPVRLTLHSLRFGTRPACLVQAEDMTREVEALREQNEKLDAERKARRRAEEAEERFRRAFEGAAVGIVLAGPDQCLEYANPALCELVGYSADELRERTLADITYPGDRDRLAARLQELLSGERQSFVTEKRGLTRDGSVIRVRTSMSALRREDGSLTHVLGVIQDLTENRQAEDRLEESRRLLEIAGTIARLGGWYVNLRDQTVHWSDEVCSILGVPPGSSPSVEDAFRYTAPEWRPLTTERFRACAEDGVPFDLEVEVVNESGRRAWVRSVGVPVRNDEGEIVAVQGAFQDISSRKAQSAEVRRLANRLVRMLESISDAFLALDRDWRISYVNREAERMLRSARGELMGRSVWEAFPDAVGTELQRQYETAVRTGDPARFTAFYPPFDTWFEIHAYPSEEGLSVFFRNVNAEREAQEALRRSEERFRMLARATTDAVWDWDLVARRGWWSDGMESLFGVLPEEVGPDSTPWLDRIHPEDRERVTRSVERVLEGDSSLWESEHRFLRGDGAYAHVQVRGWILRNDHGQAVRMIGGMRDVTAARELETRLQRVQRVESIGNLAGGIAHDLNNVLTPVLLSLGLLEAQVDHEEGRELIASMELQIQRAVGLVRQVLVFARGGEGPRELVHVGKAVDAVVGVIRETFPRSIELVLDMTPDPYPVRAAPTQIHQVLLNLCMNARDAMPSGGTLEISVENLPADSGASLSSVSDEKGARVRIGIRDTGVGMEPKVVEQIFDPFFTSKEAGGGTGLGLSIVASIVQAHGGSIGVESEPGRGSRFDVYLPAGEAVEGPVASPRESPARGAGEWILVVDDEAAVRSVTQRILTAFGYRVRTAGDGEAALAVLDELGDEVAAVVTDLMMPGMDGSDLISRLSDQRPGLPIVAASGLHPDERTSEAIAAGAVRFLPKPFDTRELLSAVREVIEVSGESR